MFFLFTNLHFINNSISAARDEVRSKNIVNAKGLSPEEGRRKYGELYN